MNEKLYCIRHKEMVKPEMGRVFGHIVEPLVYPPDWELDFCEFEQGFAYCPPPEFDMGLFMQQLEGIKASVDEDFLPYDYDVLTDQIMEPIYTV